MTISIIITSFKEPETVAKALERLVVPNKELWSALQIILVAPDEPTLNAGRVFLEATGFKNYKLLKDLGKGKPAALNMAFKESVGDVLILTDGDMFVSDDALKHLLKHFEDPAVGGVSGHPVSLDSKNTLFGYFSHLFCEAAHIRRLSKEFTPMSGYLMAVRNIFKNDGIPEAARAEDGFISAELVSRRYRISYEPSALAYVHFPKNLQDWLDQKTRSVGGNVQLKTLSGAKNGRRSMGQDLKMLFFPFEYAQKPKEYLYSALLYPLRAYLWLLVYLRHYLGLYSGGAWKRIESSKS